MTTEKKPYLQQNDRLLLVEWLSVWEGNRPDDWLSDTDERLELNFEILSDEHGQ